MNVPSLERQLDSFDADTRRQALLGLLDLERAGKLPTIAAQEVFNLHAHTFFSYNGAGYSPSHLVWRAHRQGWWALATVDFDVLDGVDETLAAGDLVGLRACSGMETRVYVPELQQAEINSPGEPGVMYLVGVGFGSSQPVSAAASVLADMRERAQIRNREMIARINAYLDPVAVDLARDVAPLTPAGNVTERHILVAYDIAARERFPRRADLLAFWSGKLDMSTDQVDALLGPEPFPHDAIRSKLMKRGGVGYAQPGPDTFPSLDAASMAISACGAVPTYAFLDGTSTAEADMEALLELMLARGIGGLTVIPDRNWNIGDPTTKALKLDRLAATLDLARQLGLPVLAGTEMNKPGQREMDDFDAPELRPFWPIFADGAAWLWGHTVMQRLGGQGHESAWAAEWLPERAECNAFYMSVGRACAPGDARLPEMVAASTAGPEAIRRVLGISE